MQSLLDLIVLNFGRCIVSALRVAILTNKMYSSSFKKKTQAVPSKGVCRQFEIDSNEHGEFDVANELWALMEGKQPALAC